MRVIAGTARGIQLRVPKRVTRPTADRVREAVFSSLAARVPGARVLDLFAGSGAMGIEALSRGAEEAVFVEKNAEATEVIRANLEKTRLLSRAHVRASDVEKFFRGVPASGRKFDLVFADPPYRKDDGDRDWVGFLLACGSLRGALSPDGLLVIECMKGPLASETEPSGWSISAHRAYGSTEVFYFAPGIE